MCVLMSEIPENLVCSTAAGQTVNSVNNSAVTVMAVLPLFVYMANVTLCSLLIG